MLSKSQRIVAFYILYEVYHHENVSLTPFEAVVYNSLQACAQAHASLKENRPLAENIAKAPLSAGSLPTTQINASSSLLSDISSTHSGGGPVNHGTTGVTALLTQSNPDSTSPSANFRAEYKLLTDFLLSVPKIKQEQVGTFIKTAELPSPIENLAGFIQNYQASMPKISGPKGHALSGVVRDLPENEFSKYNVHGRDETYAFDGIPEIGIISASEIDEDEMSPHYFVPNFVRPLPEADEDPLLDINESESGLEKDISRDAIFLIPGMLPEPYWDFNMTQD